MEAVILTALVGLGFLSMRPATAGAQGAAGVAAASAGAAAGAKQAPCPVPMASYGGPAGMPSVTYTDVRDEELLRAQRTERAAAYPSVTGVVDSRARMTATERGTAGEGMVRSLLAGTDMREEDFRHHNMTPFFRSHAPGLDIERDQGRFVEAYSGAPGIGNLRDKTERAPLFRPDERGKQQIYGNQVMTDALQVRTPVASIRNNELPFQQVRVGPGVGQGFGDAGAGGFHQAQDRDFVLPKNVDELRPLSRPKQVFDTSAYVLPGFDKSGGARRVQGLVQKLSPSTAFENDRGFLPTGTAVSAQTARLAYEPRGDVLYHDSTERGFNPGMSRVSALAPAETPSYEYGRRLDGGPAPILNNRAFGYADGASLRPSGVGADGSLKQTGRGVEAAANSWRAGDPSSGNIGAAVPRGVLPFSDGLRGTQRQFTELSERTGCAAPVGPSRLPLAPAPDHATRTTLRETTECAPGFDRGSLSPAAGGVGLPHGGVVYPTQVGGPGACPAFSGDPGGDVTRTTLRENADCEKAYENTVRNFRNAAYAAAGGLEGAEPFTPGPTIRQLTALNERDAFPTGGDVVRGSGGAGGYATLVDGMSCGAAGGPQQPPSGYQRLAGESTGDGRLEAPSTHRQFTGQIGAGLGLTLRPARPEPTGYAVAHLVAGETSTSAGLRGQEELGYFGAPRNETARPVDYGQIYAATVNSAKESLTASRARGGHAGPARGPDASTAGRLTAAEGLPDSGRATPGYALTEGNPRSAGSVALRAEIRQSDRLADADHVLSWTATNPLVNNRLAPAAA